MLNRGENLLYQFHCHTDFRGHFSFFGGFLVHYREEIKHATQLQIYGMNLNWKKDQNEYWNSSKKDLKYKAESKLVEKRPKMDLNGCALKNLVF